MTRLPHSLEPKIVFKPNPTQSDPEHRDECYIAKWRVFAENGEYKYRTKVVLPSESMAGLLHTAKLNAHCWRRIKM